jgi:sulfur-oxidizing protein SoxX
MGAGWAIAMAAASAQPVGDPARGRALVADRQRGMCLLCHPAPIAEERFQGNLAPDLGGVGSRLSADQLRARVADARRFNPQTIMPPYRATDGLVRVGAAWRDRPLFDEQQLEDVVAWLALQR